MKLSIASVYSWYRNIIRNPKYRWWVIVGTLVYVLSPFDVAPDFFFPFGEIDDMVLVGMLLTEVSQVTLQQLKERKNNKSAAQSGGGKEETIEVNAASVE
jgi:uncharacterized membrane protein YkvA (DUF1232 family)